MNADMGKLIGKIHDATNRYSHLDVFSSHELNPKQNAVLKEAKAKIRAVEYEDIYDAAKAFIEAYEKETTA